MRSFFKFNLILVLLITAAISSHNEEFGTPVRSNVAAKKIELTPGQRICQRQATILTRENFVAALDPKVVDSWDVDWGVFQDISAPIDNPNRARMMRKINLQLTTLSRSNFDDTFLELLGRFEAIRKQIEAVHGSRLDDVAKAYFGKIFPVTTSFCYQPKREGVQLGERIIVSQPGQPDITFHVKTHSSGRLSSNSTAAKLVNSQELMAYKVLQHLEIGCPTHFFQRSPEDVYIATLDASTGGSFTLFGVVSGHLGRGGDDMVGKRLSGGLIDINQNPSQLNGEAIEASISKDPVAQNFIFQMAQLDIVTRICRLHDLLNNPGNFGFFESEGKSPTIRVIDFRIMDTRSFKIENSDFEGFLVGNGLYQYAGLHRTMRYVLHDRLRQARVETANHIMSSGLADGIKIATEKAHHEVREYLSQEVFESCREELMLKFEEYVEALRYNVDFFLTKLQEWKPE